MPQSFQQRALDAIADAVTAGDLAITFLMVIDWANHGRLDLMTRLPIQLLWHFGVVSTAISDSTAYTAGTNRILNVTRSDGILKRRCREAPTPLAARLDDPYDVNYADKNWPAFYKEAGLIYIKPTPTAAETAEVTEPNFATDVDPSTGELALFPNELEPILVQYIVIQAKIRELGFTARNARDELDKITTATTGYLADFEGALPPALVTSSAPAATALTYTSSGAAPSATVTIATSIPAFLAPAAFTFSSTEIDDALAQMKDMMDNSGMGASDVETYVDTDDDLEKAVVAIQAIQAEGARAGAAIQNEAAQLREYEAELQESLGRFQTEVTARNSEVAEQVAEVQAGISSYDSKAKDNLNTFQAAAETARSNLQRYAAQVQDEIQTHAQSVARARGYLEEAAVATAVAQQFFTERPVILQEIMLLQKKYEDGINNYIKVAT